ncbi:MAG: signal recognition particle receptor subunit alpha [Candidatus Hodarchaeales archaeon]|jgi:signal recognition particle subunit SRP54
MLDSLSTSLRKIVKKIRGTSLIDEAQVSELVEDLETALIESDVNVDLVLHMTQQVRARALEEKLSPMISRTDYVVKIIHDELIDLLGKRHYAWTPKSTEINVLMFIGIQGSGKTTTIGKAALYWKRRGMYPGVICADTFRPGAYNQLNQLLEPYEIEVYGEPKSKHDATKISREGIKYFKEKSKKKPNIIFIDTSGRHKEEKGLLKEMKQIAKTSSPDEIVLVIDGTIGQNAYLQAEEFNKTTQIGSIIVTKMDGSAKGGGALSAVAATGSKIRYLGTGEKIEDFEKFDPERFVERLLGMGDLKGILERVTTAGLLDQQEDMMEAFKKGKMNLQLYKTQMKQMSNMGNIGKLLSMFPGMGGAKIPQGMEKQSKENMRRFEAIMNSMTQEELTSYHPNKTLKVSRRDRIARGSGTQVQDIQLLLKQFEMTQNMIKRMRKQRGKEKMFQNFGGGFT